jgi:hypothetical protein
MPGLIRNGRSTATAYPSLEGFTSIVSLTPQRSRYGNLSPYALKNEQGQLLENVWQGSKVYPSVPAVDIPYSSRDPRVVWRWPAEVHVDGDRNPTPTYWNWRQTLKNNPEPVRNPVGWKYMKTCLYALEKDEPVSDTNPKLDYIASRKAIYWPMYYRSVIREPDFVDLWQRWQTGENLLIIEIDGPHQESMPYYQEKYGVSPHFITNNTVEATPQNLSVLLNDPLHPFGHGYCLAWALQNYH